MNNKNYSGKDTVPFKVNPFKINSSRKEKKKKRNLIFDIFPPPFFLSRPFENSLKRRKKGGGGGNQKLKLSFLKIYLIPEFISTQRSNLRRRNVLSLVHDPNASRPSSVGCLVPLPRDP